jgi:hypothetical protein
MKMGMYEELVAIIGGFMLCCCAVPVVAIAAVTVWDWACEKMKK